MVNQKEKIKMKKITKNKIRETEREEITRAFDLNAPTNNEDSLQFWINITELEFCVFVKWIQETVKEAIDSGCEKEMCVPGYMFSLEEFLKKKCKDDGVNYEDVQNYLSKKQNGAILKFPSKQR